MNLTRREAIIKMAVMMGATVVGPRLFAADFGNRTEATTPKAGPGHAEFSADDIALLDEIGETIIPETNVPGAKAVGIGAFMAMMVNDCYYPKEQAVFRDGLRQVARLYQEKYHETFLGGTPANRMEVLNALDKEQLAAAAKLKDRKKIIRENASAEDASDASDEVPHYFRMMKELTILGYFTSEVGSTQVLGWLEVPGHFDGNVPYKKGDKPGTDLRV